MYKNGSAIPKKRLRSKKEEFDIIYSRVGSE